MYRRKLGICARESSEELLIKLCNFLGLPAVRLKTNCIMNI